MIHYKLTREIKLNGHTFDIHDPVRMEGNDVWVRDVPFLGFTDRNGEIYIYTDDTCSKNIPLGAELDPKSFLGATIHEVTKIKIGVDEIRIRTDRGLLSIKHPRQCCEDVELVDTTSDGRDLVGGVIGVFEVRTGTLSGKKPDYRKKPTKEEKFANRTYTFYEIRTSKGDVTLRWGCPDNKDQGNYGEEITLSLIRV